MTTLAPAGRSEVPPGGSNTPAPRGLVEGLATPRPLSSQLPAIFQEDDFCLRLTAAFDEGLAPIFATIGCFDSYLEPQLAPDDFVDWLASWVGVDIDETWSLDRRRRLIESAVDLYRQRGTAAGLSAHISLYAGVTPVIEDNGGCAWSSTADTPLPGTPEFGLTVRLRLEDPAPVNRRALERIIESSRPAHIPYELNISAPRGVRVVDTESSGSGDAAQVAEDAPGAVDLPGSERIEMAPPAPESAEALDQLPATLPEPEPPDGKEPSQ